MIDVHFRDFLADPLTTVRGIYDRLGLELTPDAGSAHARLHRGGTRGLNGLHHYDFADTGPTPATGARRSRRYQQYFDVASEVSPGRP